MKDLKKELAKMMLEAGENIAKTIASDSFELWNRKDFRLYIDFDHLTQTEQDRIFNELEVSLIGLYTLRFDEAIERASKEKVIPLKALRIGIQEGFLKLLGDSGVDDSFVQQWKGLIELRLKEYREDVKMAIEAASKGDEFKGKDEDLKYTWARVETMKIDCLDHIRRGKFDEKDPLWKFLTKWFITMDTRLAPLTQEK